MIRALTQCMDAFTGKNMDMDSLREAIAKDNDIQLFKKYNETETAAFLDIHPRTLKENRLKGRIACIRLGPRTVRYLGIQIADYIIGSIEWANPQKKPSESANIGLVKRAVSLPTTVTGTTQTEESRAAHLLARQTLKKPKTS
ncbi:MAG: hypothetical protein AAGL09_09090 [Pseudomonadota bacterium]